MEKLNYEATIKMRDGGVRFLRYHADSRLLAVDHARHVVNCDEQADLVLKVRRILVSERT